MPKTQHKALPIVVGAVFLALLGFNLWTYLHIPADPVVLALNAAAVPVTAAIAWLLLRNHPGRPDNPWFVPIGLVAGASLTQAVAYPNNALGDATMQLHKSVYGFLPAFPEEAVKLLATFVVIAVFAPVKRPIEAAVIGMAVGAGFYIDETVSYAHIAAVEHMQSDSFGALAAILGRALTGPFAHTLYTAIAAWGLGLFLCETQRSAGWRMSRLALWFGAAILFHGVHNAAVMAPGTAGAVASLAVIVVQWVLLIWLYRRSRAIGRQEAEVASHTSR